MKKKLNLFIEIPKATFYLFYIFIYYIEFIFNEICTGQLGSMEALGSVKCLGGQGRSEPVIIFMQVKRNGAWSGKRNLVTLMY